MTVQLKFRLRSDSAGLFKYKWDGGGGQVCAICNGGKVEDVKHFVLKCEEFEHDRCWLLERVKGILGEEEWMNGYKKVMMTVE